MKKYLYILDPFNRITLIKETNLESIDLDNHYILELNEDEVKKIVLSRSGILNGKIIEIGLTDEEIKQDNKFNKMGQIDNLKNLLNQSDYKIIKCYEAQLLNEPMPYDLPALLAERKAWRNEINTLEFELSMIG
jgi:hypothetical protein